jgi:PTH1 family peptidyl-tRNA hydrolase
MPHVLGDFARADREWLDPLLDALADNAALLVAGDDNGFMNRLSLAVPGAARPPRSKGNEASARQAAADAPQKAKGRSHIRQARPHGPSAEVPQTGPMAAMLKKLLGKD